MGTMVNFEAILISNMLGFMMLLMLLLNSTWQYRGKDFESILIKVIILSVMAMCIIEPLTFYLDGMPGKPVRVALMLLDTLLFVFDMMLGPMWVTVLTFHMSGRISQKRKNVINIICAIETLLLVINFFVPVVFRIDENNTYQRGPLFFVYFLAMFLFLVDAIVVYIYTKRRGGSLKFFPIFQFMMPLFVGVIIQSTIYGISLVWSAGAVSICGVLLGFQNEAVFRDELTGLYNRYYMDNLKYNAKYASNSEYTIAMLDMNGFKYINDKYGHAEGDVALITVAKILNHSVGRLGCAIRYAGDEFLVLLNTREKADVDKVIENIRNGFVDENASSKKEYKLGASIGVSEINLKTQSLDEIMREVDSRMYEDKKLFYSENPEYDRRKTDR